MKLSRYLDNSAHEAFMYFDCTLNATFFSEFNLNRLSKTNNKVFHFFLNRMPGDEMTLSLSSSFFSSMKSLSVNQ